MFILDRIDRELQSLKRLELKFGLSWQFSEFFDTVRILLDVLFRVFRFSKASFKGDVTEDDSQRRFLAQHSAAMLEQCCNHSKQCRNNVAKLCCAKSRRCESSRVTSP